MKKNYATWDISLRADCPHCDAEYIDLLRDQDFWDGRSFQIGEHGTEESKGVQVDCPECHKEFIVDLEY
jgi:Zn finger protein HypA/HybF involved in hydrogenase expression